LAADTRGGMNVRRVAGLLPAVVTVVADAAKAILAVGLAEMLGPQPWAVPVAATAVVVGHCWPLYTRFQGGMGLGSASFILLYLSLLSLMVLVAAWPLWYLIFRHRYRASAAWRECRGLGIAGARCEGGVPEYGCRP